MPLLNGTGAQNAEGTAADHENTEGMGLPWHSR